MAALVGIETALRNQLKRKLVDTASYSHNFLALLKGMDTVDGIGSDVGARRFNRDADVSGYQVQWDAQIGYTTQAGVDHRTGTLSDFTIADQENFSHIGLYQGFAAYHGKENVRKSTVNRHADGKGLPNYLEKVSKDIMKTMARDMDEDLFPPTNVDGSGSTLSDYAHANSKLMAVSYPLCDPASGTYTYGGQDMNASGYTGLKALKSGDTTTGYGVPSPTKIRSAISRLVHEREGEPDLGLCDSTIYDYFLQTAESKVVLEFNQKLAYGAESIFYCGIPWAVVWRLDKLAATSGKKRELMILSSINHFWKSDAEKLSLKFAEPDGKPGLLAAQWYYECTYVNTNPRADFRAFDVTTS